jgi:nitroreductase
MNAVIDAIKSRRSIRKYRSGQIAKEALDQIIEAGIYAPTAENEQPWHFTVVQNKELLDYISMKSKAAMAASDVEWMQRMGGDPGFHLSYHAPVMIVVSGRKDAIAWETDCSAAIENMLLAAESLDIGSVWLGLVRHYFRNEEDVRKLRIPEGYEPFYGVAFGYKADETTPAAPKRNADVVDYII